MDYYLINTAGDLNNRALCLIKDPPQGIGLHNCCMVLGRKVADHFPKEAKIYLREESAGIKLSGILGNTKGYFIGSKKVTEAVKRLCAGWEIEYLPFTLFNQKKRVHSTDYFIINPIGGFDCLDEEACGIEYDSDGDVVLVKKFVLRRKKMESAPHLFRIDKRPAEYVMSQQLVSALKEAGVTNIVGRKLPINE